MRFRDAYDFLTGTLRGRMIVSVAVVHAVMMSLFITDLAMRQRAMLLERQEEYAAALAETLSTSAAGWIAANDIAGLQELVDVQRHYPELNFAILADKDGRILAHTDKARRGQFLQDLPGTARTAVLSRTPALVDVAAPAMLGGRNLGWVRVGISQKSAGDRLTGIVFSGVLYALAAILIGSFIAWLMGGLITRRLYAVQDTINVVRAGNRSARSGLAGTDEAALLAREFNAMLDALAQRDADVEKSESRFRNIFEASPVAIWEEDFSDVKVRFDELRRSGVTDLRTYLDRNADEVRSLAARVRILDINRTGLEMLGAESKEQAVKELARYFTADSLQVFKEEMLALADGKTRFQSEGPILNIKGETMVLALGLAVQPGCEGTLSKCLVSLLDITDRKKAEEELRASEEKFSKAFHSSPNLMALTTMAEGLILEINDSYCRVLGYSREECLGHTTSELNIWGDKGRREEVVAIIKKTGHARDVEAELRKKSGEIVSVVLSMEPVSIDGNECFISVAVDVTERRRAEEDLRRSETALNAAQQLAQIGNWTLDLVTNTLSWSDEIYRIFEIDKEKFGASYEAFLAAIHPDDREYVNKAYTYSVSARKKYDIVHRLLMKDGRVKYVHEFCETYYDAEGRPARSIGTVQDVTKTRLAEIKLQQLNEELEQRVDERTRQLENINKELETFSYSVSHDLRAPLRAIDGFSLALLEDCKDKLDSEGKEDLRRIRGGAQRMGALIDDLLKLSRISRTEVSRQSVDLSGLARMATEELLKEQPDRMVECVIQDGVMAEGDAHLLRVVLENLFSNAWKFTGRQPKARVEFGAAPSGPETIFFVRDNGAGFDMKYAGKLFSAFQRMHTTTDFPGTGIGLATVQRIIARHGGRIWAEAGPGKGAAFFFTLETKHGGKT